MEGKFHGVDKDSFLSSKFYVFRLPNSNFGLEFIQSNNLLHLSRYKVPNFLTLAINGLQSISTCLNISKGGYGCTTGIIQVTFSFKNVSIMSRVKYLIF